MASELYKHPKWDSAVGCAFLGGFYNVAPWPVGNKQKAAKFLREGASIAPTRRNLYYAGVNAYQMGEYSKAVTYFDGALKAAPCKVRARASEHTGMRAGSARQMPPVARAVKALVRGALGADVSCRLFLRKLRARVAAGRVVIGGRLCRFHHGAVAARPQAGARRAGMMMRSRAPRLPSDLICPPRAAAQSAAKCTGSWLRLALYSYSVALRRLRCDV